MMPLRAFRASDEEDVRNIQPCFGLSGQIKDNSNKVPDSRYYAYSAMCESHTDEAQTSEENFTTNGIFLDSNEDVRNQPCFGLSGWIEDKSDEVPDDSRYAHSVMCEGSTDEVPDDSRYAHSALCEGSTDEVHTSEEFAADGIASALKTKHYFSHSDEVVLDWPQAAAAAAAAAGIEDKILCKLRHKKAVEQEKGATELRYLTREVVNYQITLCTPAVLTALVQLLQQSKHAGVLSNATAAIMNLSLPNQNKVKIVSAGAIPHIVEVLKSNAQEAHVHAAGVLFSLVINDEIRETDRFLHAIPPLIDLLKSEPLEAQHDAAMALYHLSSSQINRTKLIQAGGVAILLGVVEGDSSILARIALLTLSKLAAVTEGHNAICEANGVKELVNIFALRSLPPPLGPGMQQYLKPQPCVCGFASVPESISIF
jgi:hypothetical protein